MSLALILLATMLAAGSGLPGLFFARRSTWDQYLAATCSAAAGVLGLLGAGMGLLTNSSPTAVLPAWLMGGGLTGVHLTPISAFFLVPVFLVGALGSIYGLSYWRQQQHPANGRRLRCFWGLLVAGMALLILARHALLFLLGWEIMAWAAYFLLCTEDQLPQVRSASWFYLVATHVGTLSLFAFFILLKSAGGSFVFTTLTTQQAGMGLATSAFLLALVGFGLKAGIMPMHFWLPGAHASAPSHVSAIMSGVVLKMGIYGLVRVTALLPPLPVAWGSVTLILGAISGVLGVVFALGQHDLKRLLAYHSVENIGIITMGLGLAMIGRRLGRTDWVLLGLAGCLLHIWNHALFKSLLFLSAGSVVHSVETREIDRLGGLAKRMPWTAGFFLVGAVAICGLPPLNGFISELLIYLGLLRTVGIGPGPSWSGAALAVPVLAVIGALAVACFVKVFGAVFLGQPRTGATDHAHESPATMLVPMGVLAALCLLIGLAPMLLAPILERVAGAWDPALASTHASLSVLAPLTIVGLTGMAFCAGVAAIWTWLLHMLHARGIRRAGTWDCGYARPTARMQYTASSFAGSLVSLFSWVLRPRVHRPRVDGLWPAPASFDSHIDDLVLDRQIIPASSAIERWLARFRLLQQGLTQHYVLYILLTVMVLLLWAMPLEQLFARLWGW